MELEPYRKLKRQPDRSRSLLTHLRCLTKRSRREGVGDALLLNSSHFCLLSARDWILAIILEHIILVSYLVSRGYRATWQQCILHKMLFDGDLKVPHHMFIFAFLFCFVLSMSPISLVLYFLEVLITEVLVR